MNIPIDPTAFNKQIDITNWQAADEKTETWRAMTLAAKTAEDWLNYFQCPVLNPNVPAEISRLLEEARGAMIYSWYFHSLATLGANQSLRLLDTGTRIRCEQLGIPTKFVTKKGLEMDVPFRGNIESLVERGIIPQSDDDKVRWESLRNLRNSSSHPERQTILDPSQAQNTLTIVVKALNDLFS